MNYIVIKKFKNKLTALKKILKDGNKINDTRILSFKKEEQVKKKLDELETKKNEELEKLEIALIRKKTLFFWGGVNDKILVKMELREKTKEKIDEIEKLRRKKEKQLENLFIKDNKALDLLLELDIDKRDTQEQLILIEIKLEKLKTSEKTIKAIRSQIIGH